MSSRREPVKLADLGLAVLVLITLGIVYLAYQTPGDPPSAIDAGTATDVAPSTDADPGTVLDEQPDAVDEPLVVVLGDSFTNGGEEFDGRTWTDLVAADRGWTLETSAPGGSGYVTPGGGRPMPERAGPVVEDYPDADLWVLAAGASDVARDVPVADVVAAASEVLDTISGGSSARVVMVSPFAVAAPSDQTLALRDELQTLCESASRCSFVDATSWFDRDGKALMDPSGLNPTQQGQRRLSKEFIEVLPPL